MEKNKKLRLLVTGKCPNNCPLCCNKNFRLKDIPVVERWDYDEIMITGGEPLLFPWKMEYLVKSIRRVTEAMGRNPKIYVYTSVCEADKVKRTVNIVDGIVLTPHTKNDLAYFKQLNNVVLREWWGFTHYGEKDPSLRLNVFPEIKDFLPENLKRWKVKEVEWQENCPVPEGEDFCRLADLWVEDKYESNW